MKKIYLKFIIIFFFCFSLFHNNCYAINNSIIIKVGNEIVTSLDLENEVRTLLILSNRSVNQENINIVKNYAVKSLIKKSIKKNEIDKYNETKYSEEELENYLVQVSETLKTDRQNLKNFFKKKNLSYESFVEKNKIDLIWKTLIFKLYKNQISINMVEIEDEIQNIIKNKIHKLEYELSEIEILPDAKEIEKTLDEIKETIKREGFENAAKKFSISNSAANGGKIGFFLEDSLSKIYLNELKKIKSGEITKPIKTSSSLVILKLLSIKKIKEKQIDVDKLKERIVMQKKEEKLDLFSRSHYSNLESSTLIKFQ